MTREKEPLSREDAENEAYILKSKVELGEAGDYNEAEQQVNEEKAADLEEPTDEELRAIFEAANEMSENRLMEEKIEELPAEKQLQFALELIDLGLGLLIAKNIKRFDKEVRGGISDKLIDVFKDLKKE